MAAPSRGPFASTPEWTIREQLVLASAVQRSGDQNWVSVSRSIKPLVEDVRPADYFSQKNCAQQYASMLDKVSTPHKRKKRASDGGSEETTEQQIVRQLTEKRISHLNKSLSEIKKEYFSLMKEVELIEKEELDHKIPEMWETLLASDASAKEEVVSKQTMDGVGSSLKLKTASSAKDLVKYQEQLKLHQKHSQSHLVEASKPHAEGTKLDAEGGDNDKPPTIKHGNELAFRAVVKMETDLTPSVAQPPDRNVDLGVTVKKEFLSTSSGTPTPTDIESLLPKFVTSSEEKPLSPMQTPHPSTGLPLSTDIHIIVQQRNKAMDNLIASRESRPSSLATMSGTRVFLTSPNKVYTVESPMRSTTTVSSSPSVSVSVNEIPAIYTMQSPVLSTMTGSSSPSLPEKVPTINTKQSSVPSTTTIPASPSLSVPSTSLTNHTQKPSNVDGPPLPSLAASNTGLINPPIVPSAITSVVHSKPSTPVTAVVSLSGTTKPAHPLPSPPTTNTVSLLLQAADQKDNTQKAVSTSVQLSRPPTYENKPVSVMAYTTQSHPARNVLQTFVSSSGQGPVRAKHDIHSQPQLKMVTQPSPVISNAPGMQVLKSFVPTPATVPPPQAGNNIPIGAPLFKPSPTLFRSQLSTSVTSTQPSTPPTILGQPSLSPSFASKSPSPLVIASQSKLEPTRSPSETSKHKEEKDLERPTPNVGKFEPPITRVVTDVDTTTATAQSIISKAKDVGSAVAKDDVSVSKGTILKEAKIVTPSSTPTKLDVEISRFFESRGSEVLRTKGTLEGTQQLTKEVPVSKELEQTSHSIATTSELGKKLSPRSPTLASSDMKGSEKTTPVKMESGLKQQPPDIVTPISSPPSAPDSAMFLHSGTLSTPSILIEALEHETEEETPSRSRRGGRMTLKRSLLTRARKRKADDEGPSVESTDTEEDGFSSQATSAVPSPAPSQCSEMDADALRAHKQWKKGIMIVWRHAAQHKYANFFLHPVREEDAPGYKDLVLRPTDLSSIKRKVESGLIKNDTEFQRDMLLMFQNAFMYNSSDHEVYQIAQDMKIDVMENLQTYLATQAQLQLVEEPVPAKTLRGRRGDRDQLHEESVFSPATKKRRTRADD